MRLGFIFILLILLASCVKEGGNVHPGSTKGNTSGGTSGGTTGGTTGGTSGGSPATGQDPLASQAWHLENRGQNAFSDSNGIAGEDSSIQEVHDLGILGRGVKVAVSDSGVDLSHPDLSGNAISGAHRNYGSSYVQDWHNTDPYPSDGETHGTAVTGLIAALGWNNIGSRGVAPLAKFGAFRFIFNYSPNETQSSYLSKQLDQLQGNFDIFNMSYGMDGTEFYQEDDAVEEALAYGTSNLRNNKGAIYVQSAGNSFTESYSIKYCSNCIKTMYVSGNATAHSDLSTPYKIVVGAINARGEKSSYSSPGSNLWVSAPGGEDGYNKPAMITTDLPGCNAGYSFRNFNWAQYFDFGFHPSNPQCDYTNSMNGTSSSAPVVSGIIALMLEANPNLSWRDVKHILAKTSDKIDFGGNNILSHPHGFNLGDHVYDYKWVLNKAGYYFSNWYGFGRANAKNAVEYAQKYDYPLGAFEQTKNSSGTWYYDSGVLSDKFIYDESTTPTEHSIWVGHNYIVENVQIQITIDHPFNGDLGIILQSPGGTESRILTLNNNIFGTGFEDFTMASNAFYGEESQGFWTIKVMDGDSFFGSGKLLRWRILINGHRKSADLLNPYPPTFLTFSSIPMATDRTPVFSFAQSASHSSIATYEAMVEKASDGTVIKTWTPLGLVSSGLQLTGLSLESGQAYYLKVRARGTNGRYSSIQLKEWKAY